MSKRKHKKVLSQPRLVGHPFLNVGTHAEAVLDLRGKVKPTDQYVDVKVIIPNANGTVTQYSNRFLRR